MNIYTKTGDKGFTSLAKIQNVSKTDDRIQLLGNIDELTSNLGMVKAQETREEIRIQIERIQKNLMIIMAGIADQFNREYKLNEEEVTHLEEEIDRLENSFPRKKEFVLPGGNLLSAQMDVARTVSRRAERWLHAVDKKFHADLGAKKYMNRLADYLYMLARYTDYIYENKSSSVNKSIVGITKIDNTSANKLILNIEEEATKRGLSAVIAVCSPEGDPIAVHAMDGANLASFDMAMKKAYTSVAVKMSTKKLGELSKSGESFLGMDQTDNGRMITFGGGVPLLLEDIIIGGLGISGDNPEEDASLAEYGVHILTKI